MNAATNVFVSSWPLLGETINKQVSVLHCSLGQERSKVGASVGVAKRQNARKIDAS